MRYEIYKHTNKINGKAYIGLTSLNMHKRWIVHKKRAKYYAKFNKAGYFHRAIVKYGPPAWDHLVLEVVSTLADAEIAEIKWIAYYRTNEREFGYNCTSGGSATVYTEEVRKKLSEIGKLLIADPIRKQKLLDGAKKYQQEFGNPFKDKQHSEKTKNLLRQKTKAWHKTHDNPFRNKKHSLETRKKISDALKKLAADPNWLPPVLKYGMNDEWRKKISETKQGKHIGKITREMLLVACKDCKTQIEVSEKLGCTAANISFLMRSFGIIDEVQALLGNKTLSKEEYMELAKTCRSQSEMASKLNCTKSNISFMLKKFDIKNEVKKLLKEKK